ncbi:MAG: hypothetical protein KDD94_13035, partial [Calditrichaeota bacterium]|nr:hypothetical protein [Calditrichota bacterium]
GIHFDPIIYQENFISDYTDLIANLCEHLKMDQLNYISLGVVRFSKDVYSDIQRNYPESQLLIQEFVNSVDGKIKYKRPHRLWMLEQIKRLCMTAGVAEKKIYFCMEND